MSAWLLLAGPAAMTPHDPETRILELSVAIGRRPADADLYRERARCYLQVAEAELALADFERVTELRPTDATAAVEVAAMRWRCKRDGAALAALQRARKLGAGGPDVGWLHGRILTGLQQHRRAAGQFVAALPELARRSPRHYLECAAALQRLDAAAERASALALLDQGIGELGPAPGLVLAAIEMEMAAGRVDRALERLETLAALAARKEPWQRLGAELLKRAGRTGRPGTVTVEPGEPILLSQPSAPLARSGGSEVPDVLVGPRPEDVLIPQGAVWRYRDDNSISGTAWQQPSFDDSAWSQGPAQLGYGDGDEATVVSFGPDPQNKYITTWFRHRFLVADNSVYTSARLLLLRDDAAAIYLNGVEVARSNLLPGPLMSSSRAVWDVSGGLENHIYQYGFDSSLLRPGENVLAVEVHQVDPTSPDLSFDLELRAGALAASIIREPYLQNGTHDGVSVHWRTDFAVGTQLWIGPSPASLQLVISDPTPVIDHVAEVRGLAAEAMTFYAVGYDGHVLAGGDADHWFETLPAPGAVRPARIWVLGDSGAGNSVARAVRDGFLGFSQGESPDMLLMLGDNAYAIGADEEYQRSMFDVFSGVLRNTMTWSTLGNHDAFWTNAATRQGVYYSIFEHPRAGEAGGLPSGTEAYFSFDRGHVHCVCLDSQDSDRTPNGAMLTWLAADLASTTAAWTIAFFHHPPYTKGSHDSDDIFDSGGRMFDMRRHALPILESAGVDLVLTGHSHAYERSMLIDNHYDFSWTLQPQHLLDTGDGRPAGDGSYAKPSTSLSPHEGTVYVVAGSSSRVSSNGTLDHPVMYQSLRMAGSLVIDVDGDRLDGTFIDDTGQVGDRFTIEKGLVRPLQRDVPCLSVATGGTQNLQLHAGQQHAGRLYLLAGSLAPEPGFVVGGVSVPLTPGPWLTGSLVGVNGPLYPGSLGLLDSSGQGATAFVLPPGAGANLVGMSLYHAYIVFDQGGVYMASNAVRVRLEP